MFVRSSEGYRPKDRRRGLITLAVAAALVYLLFTGLSTVWTDYLWFDSVGFTEVWRVDLVTSLLLAAIGVVVVFGFVWGNLLLTDRLSPRLDLLNLADDEELVERFREWVEPRLRMVRLAVAGAFALLLGIGIAAWREDLLLFLNPTEFGVEDPQFGLDLGFFMFRLPLWADLVGWLFNLVALTLVLVAALHYLNGGIRLQRGSAPSMRPGVKAHLSGLAALLALLKAIAYRFDAYELVYRAEGFFGAGFTDINARLPALNLLALISLVAAVLLVWNIWRPGWTLAIVSVGSWVFVSLAAGIVYPAIVQRFQVEPSPLIKERPYLERNLEATKAAYGLSEVEVRPFSGTGDISADDIEANRLTIDNLRLWDPEVLTKTYKNLQEIRSYYRVDRVDTDRYLLDGVPTQVMIAARELEEDADVIPEDWQNQRLIYTHGFGAVVSPANAVESDGQPELIVRDVPPVVEVDELQIEQSRIYFGETYQPDDPVYVRTGNRLQEVDFPLEEGTAFNEYDGAAGVGVDGILRRLAFALRYRDLNVLISSELRDDSRILMERNIRAIVGRIAPFLAADADPYPVLLNGRVTWVMDLYTWSDQYPYSEPVTSNDTLRLAERSGLPDSGFNYVRNSVKATIDAYDGTVNLYVVDPEDPLIRSWDRVYPSLFRSAEEMPTDLVNHLRYPQDLFKIQTEMYREYHVAEVNEFFSGVDAWAIPRDPSTALRPADNRLRGDTPSATDFGQINYLDRLLPTYLMLRLPGEEELSYTLMQPFTPADKFNMSSILVADSSPGRYGRLIDYRLPRGSLVEGTGQVGDRIDQNDEISSQFTLWRGQGSNVLMGDMLVVPIENSILYVQPVYLEAQQGGLPEFRRVVVVQGNRIEWADNLDAALAEVFGEPVGGEVPQGDDDEDPEIDETVDELLTRAQEAFDQAQVALRDGDLAEYQRLVEEAESLVDEAVARMAPPTEATG